MDLPRRDHGRSMTVFLQPPSQDPPQRYFKETADRFVDLGRLAPYLPEPALHELEREFPDRRVRLWGAIPGRSNTPLFHQVAPGDLVLFYRHRRIVYGLTVAATLPHGEDLARELWGEDRGGRAWEHLYVPRSRQWLDIPYEDLWELIRFGPRSELNGLLKLDPDSSQRVLSGYGALSEPIDWREYMDGLDEHLGRLAGFPAPTPEDLRSSVSPQAPTRSSSAGPSAVSNGNGNGNGRGVPIPPSFAQPRPRRREEDPIPLGFDGPALPGSDGYGPTAEAIPPVAPAPPSADMEQAMQAHALTMAERFLDLEGYVVSRLSSRSAGHLYAERRDSAHVVYVHATREPHGAIPVPAELVNAGADPGRSVIVFVVHGLDVRGGRRGHEVSGGTIHIERAWRPSSAHLSPKLYEYRPDY